MALRSDARKPLSVELINARISGRDYQIAAIRAVLEGSEAKATKFLLVMATGTGKTRAAVSLIDVLFRARWAKRVLFLVDRIALRDQALDAFKEFMPVRARVAAGGRQRLRPRAADLRHHLSDDAQPDPERRHAGSLDLAALLRRRHRGREPPQHLQRLPAGPRLLQRDQDRPDGDPDGSDRPRHLRSLRLRHLRPNLRLHLRRGRRPRAAVPLRFRGAEGAVQVPGRGHPGRSAAGPGAGAARRGRARTSTTSTSKGPISSAR